MTGVRTRTAVAGELDSLSALCADAFHDDPLTRWTHPDAAMRPPILRMMFAAALSHALTTGDVLVATGSDDAVVGASIWLTEASSGDIPGDDPLAHRMRAIQAATDAARPHSPHVYLPSMAVDSRLRGHGIGAALMADGAGRAAARGLPVYLEASSEDNRRFYARHGFADRGGPVRITPDGPTIWPMWRESH